MPLDGHSFLVAQGWAGSGEGLRQGAINRPLAIPQKKNLSGLGKDRDEAFPFWDHLFSAAAKSIQLQVASDDEVSDSGSDIALATTATGILSNRRPVTGLLVSESGSDTPDASDGLPKPNLLSLAKREAAKSSLYARFFRGPVLGPDDAYPCSQSQKTNVIEAATTQIIDDPIMTGARKTYKRLHIESSKKRKRDSQNQEKDKRKKSTDRKAHKVEENEHKTVKQSKETMSIGDWERKQRKRLKRELKAKTKAECRAGDDPMPDLKKRHKVKKEEKGSTKKTRDKGLSGTSSPSHGDNHASGEVLGLGNRPPDREIGESTQEKQKRRKRKRTEK